MNTLSAVRSPVQTMPAVVSASMQGVSAPGVSASLQSYLADCVRDRLRREGLGNDAAWFRIRLYLCLGDPSSAADLDRDLHAEAIDAPSGLIALFGQVLPGMSTAAAMARQLSLMTGLDKQLQLLGTPPGNRPMLLQIGKHRYAVLMMHEHADCLHRVMPCPVLVFSPVD